MTHKIFNVLTRAVGYKSVPEVEVLVSYNLVEVPCDMFVELFGDTRTAVVFTKFEIESHHKQALGAEFDGYQAHLQTMIKEVILFGVPYPGYKLVTEVH